MYGGTGSSCKANWVFPTPEQNSYKVCINAVPNGKGVSMMVQSLPVINHINRTIGNAKVQCSSAYSEDSH